MKNPPPPCPPHSSCWCEEHPNNPNCQLSVSIDDYIPVLFLVALFLAIIKLNKRKKV